MNIDRRASQLISEKTIKGIWFVVSQFDEQGILRHIVALEKTDKPQFGKKHGDLALTGGETRKKTNSADCINLESGETSTDNLEDLRETVGRALEEELGIKDEGKYKWKIVGAMDVDCTKDWQDGQIGEFVVAVVHVLLDKSVKKEEIKPEDPDTEIFGVFKTSEIFNQFSPFRAGSKQAFDVLIGKAPRDKIVQALRYEENNSN